MDDERNVAPVNANLQSGSPAPAHVPGLDGTPCPRDVLAALWRIVGYIEENPVSAGPVRAGRRNRPTTLPSAALGPVNLA
jgi:hypothetical protein